MFRVLIFAFILFGHSANSLWDFAVTTKNRILFYDEKWSMVKSSAHQFDELSAITFDEAEETIYFNDKMHNNGSIFSLKIPFDNGGNDIIENVVMRTGDEMIAGIAHDPVDGFLYWTDSKNKKIYRVSVNSNETDKAEIVLDFADSADIPDGIAIDICRRKLYWSNSNHKNASIEKSDLNGSNKTTIISTQLYLPHGLYIDQLADRIFYVVDQEGIHFSVESTNLDGGDRQIVVKGLNNVPYGLVVTKNKVYWTDLTHNAVWSAPKFPQEDSDVTAIKVQTFQTQPMGIIFRQEFLSKMANDLHCKDVVKDLKVKILENPTTIVSGVEKQKEMFCLNEGEYSAKSRTCICKGGFTGSRCETNDCHNFCLHGTCSTTRTGFPECTCQRGFTGERCESYKCTDYCLNDGKCTIDNDLPTCECADEFSGVRCATNSTEMCPLFCKLLTYDVDSPIPNGCHEVCERLSSIDKEILHLSHVNHIKSHDTCSNGINFLILIVIGGVIVALLLVLAIVFSIRRFYKPVRPRIKKTFIFQKKNAHTPLTSRPAEQCEITIENCCNMQICETPCFDPKLLQQSLNSKETKDDKKTLINNMDEDLY